MALFLHFSKFLFMYRWPYLGAMGLSMAVGLLSLVNPWLTKLVVDQAIPSKDINLLFSLAAVAAVIFLLSAFAEAARSYLDKSIKLKVGRDVNRAVYAKLQDLSWSWFSDRSTGEQVYKLNYDVDRGVDFMTAVPFEAVLIFPQAILTFVIIAHLDWKMAVLAVIFVPCLYFPYYFFKSKLFQSWDDVVRTHESIFKIQQEIFSHIKLVQVFHQKEYALEQYSQSLDQNLKMRLKNAWLEVGSILFSKFAGKLMLAAVGFYGIVQVIYGGMTIGTLMAVAVYLVQLMGLQSRFSFLLQATIMGRNACERLAAILNSPYIVRDAANAVDISLQALDVVFKEVTFGYTKDVPVLKRVSFSVKGTSVAAFAGPSGCGKSTLLALIMRLYDPQEGEIFLGLHPVSGIKRAVFLNQIGIVLQEPFLWSNTVRYNISYGMQDVSQEDVVRCAQLVGADMFIRSLPQGYDTLIGENACKISEGQKQRLALARALIRKPKVLILDEAMSALDAESEALIFENIRRHCAGVTILYVSHRLSMVMRADTVCYIKSPDLIVTDTPQALWTKDQSFSAMFGDHKML